MKFKQLLTKSLLAAVCLLVGQSAWAQHYTTSFTSGTFTGGQQITSAGLLTVTMSATGQTWSAANGNQGNYGITVGPATLTESVPTAGTFIKIQPVKDLDFKLNTWAYNNMNYKLIDGAQPATIIVDERSRYNSTRNFGKLTAGKTYYIYTTESSVANGLKSIDVTSYENYTIHYKDGEGNTIKSDVVYAGLYGANVTASASDMESVEYNDKTYFYSSGNEEITLGTETNEITLVYATATPATITVKYWNNDEPAVEIKDATAIDTYVGATDITASGELLPTYINYEDNRYSYSSGNRVIATVTGDDVINLVYTAVPKYTCTVNAKAGETLLASPSATIYSGEDVTVYYQKAYSNASKWYFVDVNGSAPGYGVEFGSVTSNQSQDVTTYTLNNDVVYFAEAENLTIVGSWAANGNYLNWRSNGMSKRMAKKSYIYTSTIAPGVYDVTMWARNNRSAGTGTETLPIFLRDGDGNLTDLSVSFPGWARGGFEAAYTARIAIPDDGKDYSVAINNNTDYTSNLELDYVYLTKLPATVSKTISAAGWATYCSPYALDLSNATGLTDAYIVTGGSNGVLTKSSVKGGTVPANTGLLLKGNEGTATIPVVANSETNVANNILKGVTAETQIDPETGWVLMGSPKIGFYQNTNSFTVGANTAYILVSDLPVPQNQTADARASYLLFDDMTGISQVAGSEVKTNGVIYNLNGQRVSNPTKGIYIIDGVKVAIE